jgi:hypothetical protein
MRTVVVRWLPWALVAVALGVFLLIPGANGPVLVLVWGAIVVAIRYGVAILPDRRSRLWADGVFVIGCFLAAFEGGWYLVPAALAFLVKDRAGSDRERRVPGSKPLPPWLPGLAAAAAGYVALAITVWGPLYSSRAASIVSGAVVEGPVTPTSLAALGPTPRATVVLLLAALFLAVIAVGSVVYARTGHRWARRVLALATLGLALIAIAGAFTIGLLLVPAVVLAVFAWAPGRERTGPGRDEVAERI